MHQNLEVICEALDNLSESVLNTTTENRTLCELNGWNFSVLSRHDLARLPRYLSERVREAQIEQVDETVAELLSEIPQKLQLLQQSVVPHLFNGQGNQSVPVFMASIEWITHVLVSIIGWQTVGDNKTMPASLARRLRSIQAELSSIVPEKEELKAQINRIKEATAAAESLPTDLQALREARDKVGRLSSESVESMSVIRESLKESSTVCVHIGERKNEADKLVQQCEEAYRITTTKGLAAAFDQRATRLSYSVWAWVSGLLVALSIGAWLGTQRVELLSSAMSSSDPNWGTIWMQIVLSLLSVGAPIWFAWLATKQVGQCFRLSEDYAFKASVAKAYEGYRREAARIDPSFEARLFSSALSRLEEAPLRLVEAESPGSPWHELVNSPGFQKALGVVPELKDKFWQLTANHFGRASDPSDDEEVERKNV